MKPMEVAARRRLVRRRGILLEGLQEIDAACASDRLTGREMKELVDIEDALARMRRGEYGLCCTCGSPIGRLRLLAIPEVRSCPGCDSTDALPGATRRMP